MNFQGSSFAALRMTAPLLEEAGGSPATLTFAGIVLFGLRGPMRGYQGQFVANQLRC